MAPYLNVYLNSVQHGKGQYEKYIYGEGRPHISFEQLRMTPISLPPLDEQREIVRRLDKLFELAARVESRLRTATLRAEAITQAVLSKAFRGELVETEAVLAAREGREFESAEQLLERIRAIGSAGTPTRRRRARS